MESHQPELSASAREFPELFDLLTVTRGWGLDHYQAWVGEILTREFFGTTASG